MPSFDSTLTWRAGGADVAAALPSAVRTTSGTGPTLAAKGSSAIVTVVVTASSGSTPTLAPRLEGRAADGTWVALGAVAANIVGNGTTRFTSMVTGEAIRLAWTIGGGTPSFTFSATVEQY